ncbi:MAG: hypothetical protein ACT4OK_14095 [Gemmobacter sp.]
MHLPISQAVVRAPREALIEDALVHLRLADRLPLHVSCRCLAYWDDTALEHLRFEREADLGTCGDLAGAMIWAATSVASGLMAANYDTSLLLVPQLVTILDAQHCLVMAGEVQQGGSIRWCVPVGGDAEARRVVVESCRLRAEARTAADDPDPAAADALCCRARALEGRLVDPFWRAAALRVLDQALAA